MNTEMYLRRRNKVAINHQSNQAELDDAYLVAIQKNIEGLGYYFSADVLQEIKQMDKEQVGGFYEDVMNALKQLVGAHVKYKPM